VKPRRPPHLAIAVALLLGLASLAHANDAGVPAATAIDAGARPPRAPHDAGAATIDAGARPRRPPVDAGAATIDAGARPPRAPRDAGVATIDAGGAPVGAQRDPGTSNDAGDVAEDAEVGEPDELGDPDANADPTSEITDEITGEIEPPLDAGVPIDAGEIEEPVRGPPAQRPEIAEAVAEPPPTTKETTENTLLAIKVIVGLVALLVLAYLGGHRRVVRFQERLGLGGVITAGFPFVALGLIASLPSIGILDESVLRGLRPVLHFGLGWLGFIVGAQLDIRVLDRVPRGTAYLILVEAIAPFAITVAGCGAVMIAFGASIHDAAAWRDVILLGAAAAMTAPRRFRGFATRAWREGRPVDALLAQLDELIGVIGLLFITAYFREPSDSTWQLPDTAWVFVSVGLGVTIGVLIFAMIRVPVSNAEFLAVVLGSIAFASGLAGYLRLSPIVVCFLAGVLVTNFPNEQRAPLFRILAHLERPVQLLFLIVAGALWDVSDWRGWALVPLFVLARIVGRWLGMLGSRSVVGSVLPPGFADRRQMVVPVSSLSIALVISVEALYRDPSLPWVTTAVIGGAIVCELLLQRIDDVDEPLDALERPRPIDELDERSVSEGPVYRDDDDTEKHQP
jgi:Kef-type K+ transport system membrane component KefB